MDDHQPGGRVVGDIPGVLEPICTRANAPRVLELVLAQPPCDLGLDVVGALAQPVGVVAGDPADRGCVSYQ